MNVKELKQRWLKGYVKPELFYLPTSCTDTNDFAPMIIKVEAIGSNNQLIISGYGAVTVMPDYDTIEISGTTKLNEGWRRINHGSVTDYVYYNMKTDDNIPVNKTNFPEYFSTMLCEDLCYEPAMPFLSVDWGDGTSTTFTTEQLTRPYTKNIDGVECHGYLFALAYTNATHTYNENGVYEVIISGNIPSLNFSNQNGDYGRAKLTEIVQWGNLHLRSTQYMLQNYNQSDKVIISPITNAFEYVIQTSGMFYGSHFTFEELGGEDILKYFPNLIVANDMFTGTNITYVPDYFTQYNKKLVSISGMFQRTPIQRIGDYAFANLPELRNIHSMFNTEHFAEPNESNSRLHTIGNSVFENNPKIEEASAWLSMGSGQDTDENHYLKTIGKNMFKNCTNFKVARSMFFGNFLLDTVGESMFEGCAQLYDVESLFYDCILLRKIGKNIFKGCKNLRCARNMIYKNLQVELPDNLFYDVEYNPEFLDNNFYIGELTYGWYDYRVIQTPTQAYQTRPEIAYIHNLFPEKEEAIISRGYENFPSIKYGNNMFNPTYLNALSNSGEYIASMKYYGKIYGMGGQTSFGHIVEYEEIHTSTYIADYNGDIQEKSYDAFEYYRKRSCVYGVIPNFWDYPNIVLKYNYDWYLEDDYSSIYGYTNQHGTYTTPIYYWVTNPDGTTTRKSAGVVNIQQYDINTNACSNAASIPRPEFWVDPSGGVHKTIMSYLQPFAPLFAPSGSSGTVTSEVIIHPYTGV